MAHAEPKTAPDSAFPSPRQPILDVRDLRTRFETEEGTVHAVNGVSFQVYPGETLAIVGESGSGKSVTMLSVMGLVPSPPGRIVSGSVLFEGNDLLRASAEEKRQLRGSAMAMIFQEPLTSLNPVFTVGDQLQEALLAHLSMSRRAARARSVELLGMVNISEPSRVVDEYPHRLSGGMCQRVMLAMALACSPRLLIADEPTTALDITTQEQLLELIERLQDELGMAIVWITHDLGIVAGLADRVIVMYAGRIVESGLIDEVFLDPLHPYTAGLLGCIPRLDASRTERLTVIPGAPPDMVRPPRGCPFAPRCSFKIDRSFEENPPLVPIGPTHHRACWVDVETIRGARA